jgi:hypothetical protein
MDKNSRGIRFLVISLLKDGNIVPRHLLWNLIFKGIKVISWFLLFDYLFHNIRQDSKFVACLVGALKVSSETRKRSFDFQSQLRPIQQYLKSRLPKVNKYYHQENLLEALILILDIPKVGFSEKQLYSSKIEMRYFPRPSPLPYIGVGYKDKGSLGSGDQIEAESDEIFSMDHISFDLSILSKWNIFQEDYLEPSPVSHPSH